MVQYHYTGWPDHGLPKNTAPIFHMLQLAHDNVTQPGETKQLMHCSAGVGRTGTFIALVNLMGAATGKAKENSLSVFRTVRVLREQRMMMVERQTQYVFIYELLKVWLTKTLKK